MSADKRSVHTDALATLGTIIDSTQKRDAIHLAVEPVIAGDDISPGQDIGLIGGRATWKAKKKLGIADPFVKGKILAGQMFWLIVYPRQITSLRHVWEHPDFSSLEDKEDRLRKSEEWLKEFCESNDIPGVAETIEVVLRGDFYGDSLHFSGKDASGMIPDEFWDHMEVVTGRKYVDRPTYFSCSC